MAAALTIPQLRAFLVNRGLPEDSPKALFALFTQGRLNQVSAADVHGIALNNTANLKIVLTLVALCSSYRDSKANGFAKAALSILQLTYEVTLESIDKWVAGSLATPAGIAAGMRKELIAILTGVRSVRVFEQLK